VCRIDPSAGIAATSVGVPYPPIGGYGTPIGGTGSASQPTRRLVDRLIDEGFDATVGEASLTRRPRQVLNLLRAAPATIQQADTALVHADLLTPGYSTRARARARAVPALKTHLAAMTGTSRRPRA
jgi:hypothetical protein